MKLSWDWQMSDRIYGAWAHLHNWQPEHGARQIRADSIIVGPIDGQGTLAERPAHYLRMPSIGNRIVATLPNMNAGSSATQPLVISFELQLADVERGLASLPRARFARMAAWFGMLVVAALVAWRWHEGRDPSLLAVVGVVMIAVLFAGSNPAKRIAKRVYDALPAEARHVELNVDDSGIKLVAGDTTAETPWARVSRVSDARHSLLLFESRSNAQIIPKRALSAEQYATLRALVKQHVVPRKEPWWTPEIARRIFTYALLIVGLWMLYRYRH
jgi:hypothetical protein